MRQTPLKSPGLRTYEIDISDKSSVYSNESPKGSSTPSSQSGQENTGGNPIVQNFILLENGFYLLQEDNNKILI